MRVADWATIIAVLLGPILAVQITQWLDRNREKQNRRIWIFQTLMATRVTTLSLDHVRALNAIEIEFLGHDKGDRGVIESWRTYLAHLFAKGLLPDVGEGKRQELFTDLLHTLASVLNLPFEKSNLRNPSYYPIALSDLDNDQYQIRKATLALLTGQAALPVYQATYAEPSAVPAVPPANTPTKGT